MTPIETIKRALAEELPRAIERALESYADFSARSFPLDAKEYDAHHKACKAALAHLDALAKLVKWVEDNDTSPQTRDTTTPMQSMLTQARLGLLRIEGG